MKKSQKRKAPIRNLVTSRMGSDPDRDAKIKDIWASARAGDEEETTTDQAQTKESFIDLLETVSKTKTSQPGLGTT